MVESKTQQNFNRSGTFVRESEAAGGEVVTDKLEIFLLFVLWFNLSSGHRELEGLFMEKQEPYNFMIQKLSQSIHCLSLATRSYPCIDL